MSSFVTKSVSVFEHAGLRPIQEDSSIVNEKRGIFAVADGFGGPKSGIESAAMACQSIKEFLESGAGDLDVTLPFQLKKYYTLSGNILFNAFLHANKKLLALNKSKVIDERGGASLVAGYVSGDHFSLGLVGVCNAGLFRDGKFQSLLNPRSYQRYLEPIGPNSERSHYGIPLNPLGLTEDLEPEIFEFKLKKGDQVCLFSDGPGINDVESVLSGQINENSLSKSEDNSLIVLVNF